MSCRRFQRLVNEGYDRELSAREERFMEAHRLSCEKCEEHELQGCMSLNMLKDCALEPEPSPNFDDRVVRLVKLQTKRANIRYWSPALIGAAAAGIVLLAALQIVSRPSQLPQLNQPASEARRIHTGLPSFPDLNFTEDIKPVQ